jgi:hypothetical protein
LRRQAAAALSAALLLALGLAGGPGAGRAVAQTPLDPLAGLDPAQPRPIPGLSAERLGDAAPARKVCQELARLANARVADWEAVRDGRLDRAALRGREDPNSGSPRQWNKAHANCNSAIENLPDDWPPELRLVLQEERQRLREVWDAQGAVLTAWLEGRSEQEVNALGTRYQRALDAWTLWLETKSAPFWAGAFCEGGPNDGCLALAEDGARSAALGLWRLSGGNGGSPDLARLVAVDAALRDSESSLRSCPVEGNVAAQVEQKQLLRLLAVYRSAVDAVRSGEDAALGRSQEREQAWVSRIEMCRAQHAAGSPQGPCRLERAEEEPPAAASPSAAGR